MCIRDRPYTVGFSDPSFFGVTSLNVPAGGMSAYLRVLSLKGLAKYTLTVTGLGVVLDPDIQSGSDTGTPGALARDPAAFVLTWDTVQQTAIYTMNSCLLYTSMHLLQLQQVAGEIGQHGPSALRAQPGGTAPSQRGR